MEKVDDWDAFPSNSYYKGKVLVKKNKKKKSVTFFTIWVWYILKLKDFVCKYMYDQ